MIKWGVLVNRAVLSNTVLEVGRLDPIPLEGLHLSKAAGKSPFI